MMHLLMAHPGAHHVPTFYELTVIPFFRRLRLRRKPAVPAELPPAAELRAAGAATALLGEPVMRDRMLSEVRAEYDGLTDLEIAALTPRGEHPYPPLPTRLLRPAGDGEIVIDERGRVSVCPWPPAARPMWDEPPAREPRTQVDLPVVPPARPYAPEPVYGQECQLKVEETERLAAEMIA